MLNAVRAGKEESSFIDPELRIFWGVRALAGVHAKKEWMAFLPRLSLGWAFLPLGFGFLMRSSQQASSILLASRGSRAKGKILADILSLALRSKLDYSSNRIFEQSLHIDF